MSVAVTMHRISAGSTADVRAHTTVPMDEMISTLVHMRNRDDWPREEFLAWLDQERDRAEFKHDLDLAEAAGISHSSISGWRNGRQRPSAATLKKIAKVLGHTPHDVWLRAGIVDTDDVGPAAVRDDHEPTAEERRAIALIKASKLTEGQKKRLIAEHIEGLRRAREEVERQTRSTIALLEQD